jgi:hypothetical protein
LRASEFCEKLHRESLRLGMVSATYTLPERSDSGNSTLYSVLNVAVAHARGESSQTADF